VASSFSRFCEGRSSQADKFETLCHVQADISTAPYKRKRGESGKKYYSRKSDVILLVGLTELKAQVEKVQYTISRVPRSEG
jgi:hypothetical protein